MEMKMEGGYIFSVVLTGLVVVFIGLILLILFVWLMGKLFTAVKAKKTETVKAEADSPVKLNAPAAVPAPVAEDGISDEVVAVITAAVAAMSGSYVVRSVKKASARTSRRTAWGAQGVSESTRAF